MSAGVTTGDLLAGRGSSHESPLFGPIAAPYGSIVGRLVLSMQKSRDLLVSMACLLLASCGSDLPEGEGGVQNPAGNRAPHVDPIGAQEVSEGETLSLTFTISDPDEDILYLEVENEPEGALFDAIQGTFRYQPDFDVVSADEISLVLPEMTVRVDDNFLSDAIRIPITVHNINRPPFFLATDAGSLSEIEVQLDPGGQAEVEFQVIDPDEDEVSLRLEGSPVYARLEAWSLIVEPTEADTGTEQFSIIASDGNTTASLPVTTIVGDVAQELPPPAGLTQRSTLGEDIPVGSDVYEGRVTFIATPHTFQHGALRLQLELAEVGQNYEDGARGTSDLVDVGLQPTIEMPLTGGVSYRWRARWLSDEFGAGPYASFGGNADSEADLIATIVPETAIDTTPNDPSPIDVTFEFSSPNATDFECKMDEQEWSETGCGPTSKTYLGLSAGNHTFQVRAVTRDGTPDPTPAQHTWEVLAVVEPDTSFSSTPPSSPSCSASPSCGTITFNFSSNQTPSVTYECRLAKTSSFDGDWVGCGNPDPSKEYVGLTNGNYTFSVRAVNLVNEPDSIPASHNFNTSCSGCD